MIELTDWPKQKHIEANYRGFTNEELLHWKQQLFSLMMSSMSINAGGYWINVTDEAVDAELKFRKV